MKYRSMYFEMNSFSPGTKCVDAEMILDAGGESVIAAIVRP